MRSGHRHVEVAGFLDRLAAVERLGDGELTGAVLQQAGDAEEIFRALGAGEFTPRLERGGGGLIGGIDIGGSGEGDFREFLLVARADGVEIVAGLGRDELAVDEQAVARLDEGRRGFRRGIVFPEVAEEQFSGVRADRAFWRRHENYKSYVSYDAYFLIG